MATVNYLYRSTRKEALLDVRLLFSSHGKNYVVGGKTQKLVSEEYWINDHQKQRINDIDRANFQKEVKKHNAELETHILKAFYKASPSDVDKDWLKKQIQLHYNPEIEKPKPPKRLIKFFDFYKNLKINDLSTTRKKRLAVVKNKVLRFEEAKGIKVLIPDVNDTFKKEFLEYAKTQGYALSTLQTDLSVIKTVCIYSMQHGIETSPQLINLRIINLPHEEKPYLNFSELEAIQKLDLSKNERLDNTRDWLIISCFTGQRVSDFMRFTPETITTKEGKQYLEFTQRKTGKGVVIPFLKEAQQVVKKRNGNFPRPITPERYNDYIKEVCKLAGIDKKIKGKKLVCVADDPKKATRNDYRKETGIYPKHELASSHIGRRSFSTNYYGKVPTSYLIQVTGHSTEKMFLEYIHKTQDDKAKDAFKYFEK